MKKILSLLVFSILFFSIVFAQQRYINPNDTINPNITRFILPNDKPFDSNVYTSQKNSFTNFWPSINSETFDQYMNFKIKSGTGTKITNQKNSLTIDLNVSDLNFSDQNFFCTEIDPLSLHLDQTIPQTIVNGSPEFSQGLTAFDGNLAVVHGVLSDTAVQLQFPGGAAFIPAVNTSFRFIGAGSTQHDGSNFVMNAGGANNPNRYGGYISMVGGANLSDSNKNGMVMVGTDDGNIFSWRDWLGLGVKGTLQVLGNAKFSSDLNANNVLVTNDLNTTNLCFSDSTCMITASQTIIDTNWQTSGGLFDRNIDAQFWRRDKDFNVVDGVDVALGTGNGTKIGTAANQKIGFFGVTPVSQQSLTQDLLTSLRNLGLIQQSGSGTTPLNLNGGALQCGTASATTGTFTGNLKTSLDLNVGKNAYIDGNIFANHIFGDINMDEGSTTITIGSTNVYYEIPTGLGNSEVPNNGFSIGDSNRLIALISGKYLVSYSTSVNSAVANDDLSSCIMKNGVCQRNTTNHGVVSSGGTKNVSLSGTGIVSLTANDYITVGYANHSSTNNLVVEHINLTVLMVGR